MPPLLLHHASGRDLGANREGKNLVFPSIFEDGLGTLAAATPGRLRQFGIEGPWVVLTSIEEIHGHEMVISNDKISAPTWRYSGRLTEVITETITQPSLIPIFKSFWLAFGERRP
jgi:hypothetical protein